MMPQIMWTNYFMDAQDYGLSQTILYQDNQSASLLEKHGKMSSSKRTKHVNIQYYFIKDRINKKELSVEHCPTGDMPADFFTKPLQGQLFFKFRKAIMNE
jgi:histone deacetylase 1/2